MTVRANCGAENGAVDQFCFRCGNVMKVAMTLAPDLSAGIGPTCRAAMAVVTKRFGLGLALVILGMALTPVFGFRMPIFIVGYLMRFGGKGRACYRCPRCNYSTA